MPKYKDIPKTKREKSSGYLAAERRRKLNDRTARKQQQKNKKRGW
jgi:hypothetical protein